MKGCGFLYFAKNIGKNANESVTKNLRGKYSQKLFYHVKQYATDKLKTTTKKVIQKTANSTGDLIGMKIVEAKSNAVAKSLDDNKITSTTSGINSKTDSQTNKNSIEIPEKIYTSPVKRQHIIDELRLM